MYMKAYFFFIVFSIFLISIVNSSLTKETVSCEVIIAGGSLSALSAAYASASEGVKTCLLEPTDWIGGQLTASAVPAIDFAWHTLTDPVTKKQYPVYQFTRQKENIAPSFYEMLQRVSDTGKCWVSIDCYLPQTMIEKGINPMLANVIANGNLKIFYNTVPKRAHLQIESSNNLKKKTTIPSKSNEPTTIIALDAIQRTLKPGKTDNRLLADSLPEWYSLSTHETGFYNKKLITFNGTATRPIPIFVEGTEWGELLALTTENYLQGTSEQFDGDISKQGNELCGQSTVFDLVERFNSKPTDEPENPYPVEHPEYYSLEGYNWNKVWTYRRLFASRPDWVNANMNDLSLQNWGSGNDYPFGYLYKSFQDTKQEILDDDWTGGVNLDVIKKAEWLAIGWHYAFKAMNASISKYITLDRNYGVLGSYSGLAKVPYIRDTRRSIGLDGFVLKVSDISGDFMKSLTGTRFADSVGIGTYTVDIHSLRNCKYPDYITKIHYPTLPSHLPFRSFTNLNVKNMITAGKTMAQSFLTNSATRVHPVEYHSGIAGGVAAAFMSKKNIFETERVFINGYIDELKETVKKYQPIYWTINYSL